MVVRDGSGGRRTGVCAHRAPAGVPSNFVPAWRAYLSILRLTRAIDVGPWIRLYSFSRMVVLNAQLQASLSIADYGQIARTLPRSGWATGWRTRAARRSAVSTRRFDELHARERGAAQVPPVPRAAREAPRRPDEARLLGQRAHALQPLHARAAAVPSGLAALTLYPWPTDGFRDGRGSASLRRSRQRPDSGRGKTWSVRSAAAGTVRRRPGRREPRVYTPSVTAVDLAGNAGRRTCARSDRGRPHAAGRDRPRRGPRPLLDGGRQDLALGSAFACGSSGTASCTCSTSAAGPKPARPRSAFRRHQARLTVFDSTGNRTRVPLGAVPVPTA